MAQRLLTEEKISIAGTEDFSSLAWKFNNLNSTAKMLLVGGSSQSVPFIPISELASNDQEQQLIEKAETPQYLALSTLTAPSIYNQEVLNTLHKDNHPPSVAPASQKKIIPVREFSNPSYSEPFSIVHTEEKEQSIKSISYKPSSIEQKQSAEIGQHTIELENTSNQGTVQKSPFEVKPAHEEVVKEQTSVHDFLTPQWDDKYATPIRDTNGYVSGQIAKNNSSTPAWTYRSSQFEEEEYYSVKPQDEYKGESNPFLKKTVQSVAVVSLIALLGVGGYNLLKKYSEKSADKAVEQDNLSGSGEEIIAPNEESLDRMSGSSSLSDKTFFDEENKNTKFNDASSSNLKQESVSASPHYYQPTVRSIKNTIKASKPKVYTVQPANKIIPSPKAISSSTLNSTADSSPTVFLYDPTTVYDSSANQAIAPETYTAERFPVEVSYPRQNQQYEANFSPNNYSTAETSSDNRTGAPITTPYSQSTRVQSGYPATENTSTVNPIAEETKTTLTGVRINSGYPVQESTTTAQSDLTPEEKAILNTPEVSNSPTSTTSQVPVSSFRQNNPYEAPQAGITEQSSISPTPIYSNSLNSVSSDQDPTTDDSQTNEVPVLREPVQSSSNSFMSSPYKSNTGSMTTSTFVTQDTPTGTANSSYGKTYTQAQKGKISRLFGANKQGSSPVTQSDSLQKAQTPTMPQDEKTFIGSRLIVKKVDDPSSSSLQPKTYPRWNEQSNVSDARLNQLEAEASSVYVHPSPYNPNTEIDGVNIGSL